MRKFQKIEILNGIKTAKQNIAYIGGLVHWEKCLKVSKALLNRYFERF